MPSLSQGFSRPAQAEINPATPCSQERGVRVSQLPCDRPLRSRLHGKRRSADGDPSEEVEPVTEQPCSTVVRAQEMLHVTLPTACRHHRCPKEVSSQGCSS